MPGATPSDPTWLTPSLSRGWGWYASRLALGGLFLVLHVVSGWWGVGFGVVLVLLFLGILVLLRATQVTSGERGHAVRFTLRVNEQAIADGVVEDDAAQRRFVHFLVAAALLCFGVGVGAAMVELRSNWMLFATLTPLFMGFERLARGLSEIVPSADPVPLTVSRRARGFVVGGRGAEQVVGPEPTHLRDGRADLAVEVVEQFTHARWLVEQAHIVFPLVMAAVTVLAAQITFIVSLLMVFFTGGGEGGPTVPEPSAEYLTRLLNGDYAGAEKGVIAKKEAEAPSSETKIESYYLPAGSDGPIKKVGGARRTGSKPRSDDPRPQKAEDAAVKIEELGATEALHPQDAPDVPTIDELADPLASADGKQEEFKESVEVTEGWGLTDWYDTEDARKDATEIQQTIDVANELLKLDPDNLYGLSIKAYYEYLAMNYDAAEATYERQIQIDGTSGAPWNNLALVYKRRGDYKKEEELYHTAIMMEPNESNTYLNLALCLGHQARYDEALQIMKKLETDIPEGDENEGYADLYRSQIYAMMGEKEKAYFYLRKSLKLMRKLDTLHNIEFQQDIRVDPAFKEMREEPRFKRLLMKYYGDRPGGWWLLKGGEAAPDPGDDP